MSGSSAPQQQPLPSHPSRPPGAQGHGGGDATGGAGSSKAVALHQPSQPPRPPESQNQSTGVAGSSKGITFEEVSKHFNLPIADAATNLGVCTSVLKRICRNNGILRWPYRQLLAGKTLDDIKVEAAREKSRELSELLKVAKASKQEMNSSTTVLPTFAQHPIRSITQPQESAKLVGHASHQQGLKPQLERSNINVVVQSTNSRGIPNYIDEFEYGFPSNGLTSVTKKWWGSGSNDDKMCTIPTDDRKQLSGLIKEDSCFSTMNEILDCNESDIVSEPISRLFSLRQKAVRDGRKSLQLGVSRGYRTRKLSAREKSVLLEVFDSSLPSQWKYSFS